MQPENLELLVTTDTRGGGWTHTLELARGLSRRRVSVTVAALGRPLDQDQRQSLRATGARICEAPFDLDWMMDPWERLTDANRWLLGVYERIQPDVVHLNGTSHAAMQLPGPTVAVGHGCARTWWWSVMAGPAPVQWSRGEEVLAAGLHRADAVVCATESMAELMERCYGRSRGLEVIRPGRCGVRFRPGVKTPMVLSAGRIWDEGKNLDSLDEAASLIRWPVRVAGRRSDVDGSDWTLRSTTMLGQLSEAEMTDQIGRASIFAFPARYAPLGMAPLEAALGGCALVLGDVPSLRETWGDAAVYVPTEDPSALAEAVNGLIADPERRRRLGRAARRRALQMSPTQMVRGFERLYRRLHDRETIAPTPARPTHERHPLDNLILRPRGAGGVN